MEEISAKELVETSYINYGKYVNSSRAIPYIMDGLKPSYRRTIYTSIKNGAKKQKSNTLLGETMKIHPHGDNSVIKVITQLVNRGIFERLGNFGFYAMYGESMGAASPRYTHTKLKDSWYNALSDLMEVIPYKTSTADDSYQEPEYLPFPIPMCLAFGTSGIGLGISCDIPAFSVSSIIEAYRANDPSLLRPAFDIELDYELSDLQGLWDNGYGRIVWKYHVEKDWSEDGSDGVYIYGNTLTFTPDWSVLDQWREQGRVFIRDESIGEKGSVFIGRNKGIRAVTQDMIYEEALRCSSSSEVILPHKQVMRLAVYDGKIARYISMKEWIDVTYTNYCRLIEEYKDKHIKSLLFQKEVYTYLREVAELIFDNPEITQEEICDQLDLDLDIVKAILRKSINTLRKADTEYELSKIEDGISYYKSITADHYIDKLISELNVGS